MNITKIVAISAVLVSMLAFGQVAEAQSSPSCSPSTQVVNLNDFVSFSASGGSGGYYWLAANGSPNSGSGQSFGTRFNVPGDHVVILTSNGRNSLCLVRIAGGQVLGVSDVSTGPGETAAWAALIGLLGSFTAYRLGFRKWQG